jgi:alpha-beta hydrolase superfamily lysophospholipase
MRVTEKTPPVPQSAAEHLRQRYGKDLADQLTGEPLSISLPHYFNQEGQLRTMDYVVASSEVPDAPTALYIPGFGESRVNKLSTAAEFAVQGMNMLLPNPDRGSMLRNPQTSKRDPIYSQTLNMLELIRQVQSESRVDGQPPKPVHLVAHSFGALLVDEMARIAKSHGYLEQLKHAEVFLLAPAGLRADENLGRVELISKPPLQR